MVSSTALVASSSSVVPLDRDRPPIAAVTALLAVGAVVGTLLGVFAYAAGLLPSTVAGRLPDLPRVLLVIAAAVAAIGMTGGLLMAATSSAITGLGLCRLVARPVLA
jgi:hypothetical protein